MDNKEKSKPSSQTEKEKDIKRKAIKELSKGVYIIESERRAIEEYAKDSEYTRTMIKNSSL